MKQSPGRRADVKQVPEKMKIVLLGSDKEKFEIMLKLRDVEIPSQLNLPDQIRTIIRRYEEQECEINLWDVPSCSPQGLDYFLAETNGVCLVYDVDDPASIDYLREILTHKALKENKVFILACYLSDVCLEKRLEPGKLLAEENKCRFESFSKGNTPENTPENTLDLLDRLASIQVHTFSAAMKVRKKEKKSKEKKRNEKNSDGSATVDAVLSLPDDCGISYRC